jgi:hypothetical protein
MSVLFEISRAGLVAARNSQDFACCARAISMRAGNKVEGWRFHVS